MRLNMKFTLPVVPMLPPPLLKHVRTFATVLEDHLVVESATLLFRNRGDVREGSFVSAGREDLLRRTADGWKLARRTILVDDSVMRMQNLAIFL